MATDVVLTEADVRRVLREELEALLPHLKAGPALLTIRECATRYRRGYDTVARMARRGELMAVERPVAGKPPHLMIVAADAERKLGGGA